MVQLCSHSRTVLCGRERNADQRGQRSSTEFSHDRGTMIVDGALADVQVRRDVLARASS